MFKKNITAFVLITSICMGISSCSDEPVRTVTRCDNDFVIEHYTEGIDASDKTEYEQIVFSSRYFDFGPHEPWYRCNEFANDTFKFVNVHYAVFNGDVIIFDIQTM